MVASRLLSCPWALMGLAMCGWVTKGVWCKCGVLLASAQSVSGLACVPLISGDSSLSDCIEKLVMVLLQYGQPNFDFQ